MAARTTTKVKGNKAKGRQSSKKRGYYERQFFRTTENKVRRARRAARRKEYWARVKLETVPNPS